MRLLDSITDATNVNLSKLREIVKDRGAWCAAAGVISPLIYSSILGTPTDLGSSFFSILSFCLFILFMGFSRQEY